MIYKLIKWENTKTITLSKYAVFKIECNRDSVFPVSTVGREQLKYRKQ